MIITDVEISRDSWRDSPLIEAVTTKRLAMVKLLLDYGADVNFKTRGKETALGTAVQIGNPQILKLLLHHGADVDL